MSQFLALTGILLLQISLYLLWKNEANQVCSTAAFLEAEDSVVAASSISPKSNVSQNKYFEGCDPTGKVGDFVYLNCPVGSDLATFEPSTGVVAQGAYKLSFFTQQYGYKIAYSTQSTGTQSCRTSSDGSRVCTDDTESCHCYSLEWTANPVRFINRSNLCRRCYHQAYIIQIPFIPKGQNPATGLGHFTEYAASIPLGNNTFTISGGDISKIGHMPQVKAPQLAPNAADGPFHFQSMTPQDCSVRSDLSSCWYSTALRTSSHYNFPCVNCYRPGDLRMTLTAYGSTYISALGRESLYTDESPALLEPAYFGESTRPRCDSRPVLYIADGYQTESELFSELRKNVRTTIILMRFLTYVMNVFALALIFHYFDEELYVFVFALCAGILLWMAEYAMAWIFYRPELYHFAAKLALTVGAALILIVVSIAVLMETRKRWNQSDSDEESNYDEYIPQERSNNDAYIPQENIFFVSEATPIYKEEKVSYNRFYTDRVNKMTSKLFLKSKTNFSRETPSGAIRK